MNHHYVTSVEQALAYIDCGWRVIPVPLRQKIPIIEDWPNLDIKRDEVDRYFGERCNIGVVLGDVSGGLVDIDLDSPAAVQLATLFLPETMAFGRVSKPHSHFLYIAKGGRTEKFTALDRSMIVEVRGNGGQHTIFPESVHPCGEVIEWDVDYDRPAPLEVDAHALTAMVARLASSALLVSVGWTHDRAVRFANAPDRGALGGIGEKVLQRLNRWLGLIVPQAARPRLQSVPSREQLVRRARAYLTKVPSAVSGQGGHQQTWEAALSAIRGFDLSETEAIEVLEEYNRRCDPPWSAGELQHKVSDALRADRVGRGWLVEQGSTPGGGGGAGANGAGAVHGAVNNAASGSGSAVDEADGEDVFPIRAIATVPDEGPAKWLVRDLWLEQAVGIIGGEPKSYKSFAAAQLATCVAAGKPMFGKYDVSRGRVLMFNAEDRPPLTRDRIGQMCRALDVSISDLDLHLIDVPALRLDDGEQIERLSRTVARVKPTLLILDPMRNLHGLDENDARVVSALLSPLRVMQRQFGCAVILVHHMAKVGTVARRAGQRLRGSSALHGWVDSALYLMHKDPTKKNGDIVVMPEHRSAASPDPFIFKLALADVQSGPAMWLDRRECSEDGDSEEARERGEEIENAVIRLLMRAKEPKTKTDLCGMCDYRDGLIIKAVDRLVVVGMLDSEPVQRGKRTVPGFFLREIKPS